MEARAYIEKGWCQQFSAQTERGYQTLVNAPEAARWCTTGALTRATDDLVVRHKATRLLAEVTSAGSHAEVIRWNDEPGRTQEEVLDAFDRAIALGLERAGER